MAIYERVFPGLNNQVLSARGNLAQTLSSLGEYDEAEEQFEELLAAMNELYGAQHQNIAHARVSKSFVLGNDRSLLRAVIRIDDQHRIA